MPRVKKPWFRCHVEMLHDRKLRRLPPAQRWVWMAVLSLARQSDIPGRLRLDDGAPIELSDIVDEAAVPEKDVKAALASFLSNEMVHTENGEYVVTHWRERQFESDDVTIRTTRHRAKNSGGNDPQNSNGASDRNVPTPDVGTFVGTTSERSLERDCNVRNTASSDDRNGFRNDVGTVSPSRVQNPRVTEIQSPRKTEVIVGGSDSVPDLSAPVSTTAPALPPVSQAVVSPDDFPRTLEEDRQRRARQRAAMDQSANQPVNQATNPAMNTAAMSPPQHSGFGNLGGSTARLGARWAQARDARAPGGRNAGN